MDQRTDEWYAARLGKVTASRIADAVARTRTGWGASRANYMAALVAERLTGAPYESFQSPEMRRGTELEPEAREAYTQHTGHRIELVGFVLHPSLPASGASPDGLIGEDGLIEIKCPNTAAHIELLLGAHIEGRYYQQMQWQMACTVRSWCHYVSYDPRMPEDLRLYIQRVERDGPTITALEKDVQLFLREVETKVQSLRGLLKVA